MTYEQMLALQNQIKTKAKPKDNQKITKTKPKNEEHKLQCACVEWFRRQYPKYSRLLYAVPNGGRRDAKTGKILKDEGVVRGVSDLNLDIANRFYHGLRIEMKTPKGIQSKEQKEFQAEVEAQGFKYIICRSRDEFIKGVTIYIENE